MYPPNENFIKSELDQIAFNSKSGEMMSAGTYHYINVLVDIMRLYHDPNFQFVLPLVEAG